MSGLTNSGRCTAHELLDRTDNGRIDSARFEPEKVFDRCGYLVDRQEGRNVISTRKSSELAAGAFCELTHRPEDRILCAGHRQKWGLKRRKRCGRIGPVARDAGPQGLHIIAEDTSP
jgi:hypothetical protein